MQYERLTPKDLTEVVNMNDGEDLTTLLKYACRLHELEDKIEDGTLIDTTEPFIQVDNTCSGKKWYNICTPFISAVIHEQCATMEEAEAKLKELER